MVFTLMVQWCQKINLHYQLVIRFVSSMVCNKPGFSNRAPCIMGISGPCGCKTLWIFSPIVEFSYPLDLPYPCVFLPPHGFFRPLSN